MHRPPLDGGAGLEAKRSETGRNEKMKMLIGKTIKQARDEYTNASIFKRVEGSKIGLYTGAYNLGYVN